MSLVRLEDIFKICPRPIRPYERIDRRFALRGFPIGVQALLSRLEVDRGRSDLVQCFWTSDKPIVLVLSPEKCGPKWS